MSCVIRAFYIHKFQTDKRPDPENISYEYLSRVGFKPTTYDTGTKRKCLIKFDNMSF